MDSFKLKICLGEIISAITHSGAHYHVLPPSLALSAKAPEDYTMAEFCSRFASLSYPAMPAALDDIWPVARSHTARFFGINPATLTLRTVFRDLSE